MLKSKINLVDYSMLVLIAISLFFISNTFSTPQCSEEFSNSKPILVTYQIDSKIGSDEKHSKLLTIARTQNQIIYSSEGIIKIWEKVANNQIKLYKYFKREQRGIEYQPIDIVNSEKIDWDSKRQIISDKYLQQFSLEKQKTKKCKVHQRYVRPISNSEAKNKNESIKIVWLSAFNLPEKLEHKRNKTKTNWKIIRLETKEQRIVEFVQSFNQFKLTDYSDIGDNESDPFLQKMINLGFVAHSEQTYYSSKNGIYSSEKSHGHTH